MSERLLCSIANSVEAARVVLYNVHRDTEKHPEPYEYEPIIPPEPKLSPEEQARRDQEAAEAHEQAQREQRAIVTSVDGMALLRGEITMDALSQRYSEEVMSS